MASNIQQHLPRLEALMDKVSELVDKIRESEGYGAAVVEAGDMWGKIKDKVEALQNLNRAIDIQEEHLKSNDVPAEIKDIIRPRLERDIQDAQSKIKSALRVEKQVSAYVDETLQSLTTPKKSEESPKKQEPPPAKEKKANPKSIPPKPSLETEQKIIKHMEDSVNDFQKGIPEIEKAIYEDLLGQVKDLQVQGGKILSSVQNLKLINSIANKLDRLLITNGYKDSVKEFLTSFNIVETLQKQYFADFNLKFKPSKTLPIIKEMAIDTTLNDLLGQGLQVNIVDSIKSILQDNVTSGGSYASLNNQLRASITGTDQTDGILQRYSRTITTDSINQYSAQYHEALAMDLNMNWGRYVGSNLTTTREFCEYLTKKEWVHKSELPTIIEGVIDGHECKLSKTTGLPLGMKEGTNADNFKVRRGGWNCGHQFFWVPDVVVPEAVKARIS
jgi:hypothetical protein